MASTDQYDRMNSDQLQAEAQQRGLDLDEFQQLANNRERAQRLRDHDAARDADAQVAQQNAEAQRQAAEQQAQAQASDQQQIDQSQVGNLRDVVGDQPQAQTGSGQPQDADIAPYGDDQSLANAQAAARGDLRTSESIDTSDVEQVGGDPAYTDDQDKNYNQDR